MAKIWTPEERAAFAAKMKALREAKKNEKETGQRVENVTELPEVPETPVEEAKPSTITLNFKKKIDVSINGVHYPGPVVEVTDIKIASEIVRLAKDAYGYDILT